MKKLIIGGIPGHKDVSGVLREFMKKWRSSITPKDLAAFLQGKNAWDGSFTDVPSNSDGLIDELMQRLLSGSLSIAELKLFIIKRDYTDKGLVQLQMIKDFYSEVFDTQIHWRGSIPSDGKFMIFHPGVNYFAMSFRHRWNTFRFGIGFPSNAEKGFQNCYGLGFPNATNSESFVKYSTRYSISDKQYLLSLSEKCQQPGEETDSLCDFRYPYENYDNVVQSTGITLNEAYVLSMFEYWKRGQYFPFDAKYDCIVVPCLGSVCFEGNEEAGLRPIPLIVLSNQQCESVWASTMGNKVSWGKPMKIYTVTGTIVS